MASTPIPARHGAHTLLHAGQSLKITNPTGTQVVDTWAFSPTSQDTPTTVTFNFKYLSPTHTRSSNLSLRLPAPPSTLYDNTRQPILTLVSDTSGGTHDMLFAACCPHRYAQLGAPPSHASCAGNLQTELRKAAGAARAAAESGREWLVSACGMVQAEWTPDPLNLFMNVRVDALGGGVEEVAEGVAREGERGGGGGKMDLRPPTCVPGGYVVLRAEQECCVVMSACPMDLNAVNGWRNEGAEFEVS